ncbi:MAG TPA: P27 family phage terminase small subunit [Bryobacteraceae bacterium]|jgi:P27 family predicted phage terminase small subunit|nr:P27 family phage terminase small subunit [Bryobacteraceae bacterium]
MTKTTESPGPTAPEHLSIRARSLWDELIPRAQTSGRRVLLQTALEALDRADQARQMIAAEGLVSRTKATGVVRIHPAAKIEREARADFTKIWTTLGFARQGYTHVG